MQGAGANTVAGTVLRNLPAFRIALSGCDGSASHPSGKLTDQTLRSTLVCNFARGQQQPSPWCVESIR